VELGIVDRVPRACSISGRGRRQPLAEPGPAHRAAAMVGQAAPRHTEGPGQLNVGRHVVEATPEHGQRLGDDVVDVVAVGAAADVALQRLVHQPEDALVAPPAVVGGGNGIRVAFGIHPTHHVRRCRRSLARWRSGRSTRDAGPVTGAELRRPAAVDFHFDVMCPFAYQASRWIRDVRDQTGIEITWRFFSLEEINRADGKKHPWERAWSYGWSMMRIGALLRRREMAELDAWYARAGRALHVDGHKPHDPDVARLLLAELGHDPGLVDEAIADPTTHDDVLADHRRVVDAGGYGVPTLFFPDGTCLFGPVLIDPPTGDAALRLWDAVTAWLEFPHLFELQRPKSAADQQAIVATLAPYLAARDWVSIDRGRVVALPEPAG
jgi:2-hydroxychromene-2-carboxylate isomerase